MEQDLSVFPSQMKCGYLGRIWKSPDEIRGNRLFCGKVETEGSWRSKRDYDS